MKVMNEKRKRKERGNEEMIEGERVTKVEQRGCGWLLDGSEHPSYKVNLTCSLAVP
jgi:hypothetical protein